MIIKTIISIIALFLIISLLWRLSSHRYKIPCPTWLAWMVEMDNPFSKINRAATIIENIDLKPGMKVLDVGCGPGRLTIPMAQKIGSEGKVVALDIQQGMLDKVQEKAQNLHLNNISYIQGGIGERKLQETSFDRIILVTVLGEIPDQKAALQEIFDVLKPGSILSITEIIFDPHFQRKNHVLWLAHDIGFQEKATFGTWWAYTLNLEKPL